MEDLNKFKQKMHEEIKDISTESQNLINEMEIDALYKNLDKNGVMTRVAMMPDYDRTYAYGCMEVIHQLETVDEKYAACRFFHLLEIGSKKWPELALFAKAFLERSGGTTKTAAC
jgi:hypothetical protein